MKKIPMIVGIAIVFIISLYSLYILAESLSRETNIDLIQNYFYKCVPFGKNLDNNLVILRIDDVQEHYIRSTFFRMVEDMQAKKIVFVAGIIPLSIQNDVKTVSILKRYGCNIEIAVHGLSHNIDGNYDSPEFGNLSEDDAKEKILRAEAILSSIHNSRIITFIPPGNIMSNGTINALNDLGFKVISSEGNNKWDYHTSTYDFIHNRLIPIDEIVQKCHDKFNIHEPCVIMIHPQDYATNEVLDLNKYSLFTDLLDRLEEENVSFIRFNDVVDKNE